MPIDVDNLAEAIASAIRGELSEGWGTISSFTRKQSKLIAAQTELILASRITGSLRNDDQLFKFFMTRLAKKVENFTRSVAMLTILTLEKAWNAAANVIWGTINQLLAGAGLGAVTIPSAPKA